jgi:hypothetical protein
VIAITTYTEPIPVNPVAVSELPQVQQLKKKKRKVRRRVVLPNF